MKGKVPLFFVFGYVYGSLNYSLLSEAWKG